MNITKEQFNKYRKVQFSGVTNMADVTRVVQLTGLDKNRLEYIKENYAKLEEENGEYEG